MGPAFNGELLMMTDELSMPTGGRSELVIYRPQEGEAVLQE